MSVEALLQLHDDIRTPPLELRVMTSQGERAIPRKRAVANIAGSNNQVCCRNHYPGYESSQAGEQQKIVQHRSSHWQHPRVER
jgi:hypothetical protein